MSPFRTPGRIVSNTAEKKELEALAIQLKHGNQNHVGSFVLVLLMSSGSVYLAFTEESWLHLLFPAIVLIPWEVHFYVVRKGRRLAAEASAERSQFG